MIPHTRQSVAAGAWQTRGKDLASADLCGPQNLRALTLSMFWWTYQYNRTKRNLLQNGMTDSGVRRRQALRGTPHGWRHHMHTRDRYDGRFGYFKLRL